MRRKSLLGLQLDIAVRYLLPIAFLAVYYLARWSTTERTNPPPITENALQDAIADLNAIQAFIPNTQILSRSGLSLNILFRVCGILYLPYLLVTHFIPLRILFGLVGTVILSWWAPWSIVIRSTLSRSAWLRWSVYHLWVFLSGKPLPPRMLSKPVEANVSPSEAANSLRFLFTIYENQRWWMGLDFTAALLPSERPSWSTQSGQPIQPPNLFTLPEDTIVYLREQDGKRVKRTATWRWEEPEWRVLVRKEDGVTNRVERPLPSTKDESASSTSILMKKMKEINQTPAPSSGAAEGEKVGEEGEEEADDEDLVTDGDGWVYGDNKWEGKTAKAGMGKYTRFRRWTRVAIVIEVVEVVEDGEIGIERGRTAEISVPEARRNSSESGKGSPLRQRLQSALAKGSQSCTHS
uniref:TECPR1-like DysF domain-containing protein n=1 Tax=Moniliophthora roreri TaxID=221103 RepID=A0A0W0GDZ1_MONRR